MVSVGSSCTDEDEKQLLQNGEPYNLVQKISLHTEVTHL